MAPAVEVVHETHSLTEDNEQGRATGWLPGRLSERGRALAAEPGARRRADGLAAVLSATSRPGGRGASLPLPAPMDWQEGWTDEIGPTSRG